MDIENIIIFSMIVFMVFGLFMGLYYALSSFEGTNYRQELIDRGCHVVSTELHPKYGPIETWVCPDESETP